MIFIITLGGSIFSNLPSLLLNHTFSHFWFSQFTVISVNHSLAAFTLSCVGLIVLSNVLHPAFNYVPHYCFWQVKEIFVTENSISATENSIFAFAVKCFDALKRLSLYIRSLQIVSYRLQTWNSHNFPIEYIWAVFHCLRNRLHISIENIVCTKVEVEGDPCVAPLLKFPSLLAFLLSQQLKWLSHLCDYYTRTVL